MGVGWVGGDARLQEAQKLGAKGQIVKPFNKDTIKAELDKVLLGK